MEDTLNIKSFLKILEKVGYPNPKIVSISDMVDYNLDYFLVDLKNEIGEEGVVDFCRKAISKLQGEDGMRVNLETDGQEYVVVKIQVNNYDEEESENDVLASYKIIESKILTTDVNGNETYKTIEQINDELDMGEWSEYDEMIDHITMKIYNYVFSRCGFGLWYE